MHELYLTDQFKRNYKSLTQIEQQAMKRALERMGNDLRYPGLRVKKHGCHIFRDEHEKISRAVSP